MILGLLLSSITQGALEKHSSWFGYWDPLTLELTPPAVSISSSEICQISERIYSFRAFHVALIFI